MKFLEDSSYLDTLEKLESETTLNFQEFQIADNLSLEIVFKDFLEYY